MKQYVFFALCASGLSLMCASCLGGDETGVISGGLPCFTSSSGAGGDGGSGGSPVCPKPKQIRILTPVNQIGVPVAVNYDSLDRLEERFEDTTYPITELAVGDVLNVDPTLPLQQELVIVNKVGYGTDENGKKHRAFTTTYTRPHGTDTPATQPIDPGCPPFKMPVQEACTDEGTSTDIGAQCMTLVCKYGELVTVKKPEGTPCVFVSNSMTCMPGTCRPFGYCLP